MRKYLFVAMMIASATASPATAETLKGGYPGCVSKEYLDQFYDAVLKHDDLAASYLLDNGVCILTVSNLKASVLEANWGSVRVRVYKGRHTAEIWTSSANIQP